MGSVSRILKESRNDDDISKTQKEMKRLDKAKEKAARRAAEKGLSVLKKARWWRTPIADANDPRCKIIKM